MQTPDDGAVVDGSSFSMTCDVNAGVHKPPTIQWMHNETRVVKEERGLLSTYHVPSLNETNGGRYGCWVKNEEGSASKNLPNLFEAAGMVLFAPRGFSTLVLRFFFQFVLKLSNFRRRVTTRQPATSSSRGKVAS